jgi:hypothetical protein
VNGKPQIRWGVLCRPWRRDLPGDENYQQKNEEIDGTKSKADVEKNKTFDWVRHLGTRPKLTTPKEPTQGQAQIWYKNKKKTQTKCKYQFSRFSQPQMSSSFLSFLLLK